MRAVIFWLVVLTIALWAFVGALTAVIFIIHLRDMLEERRARKLDP